MKTKRWSSPIARDLFEGSLVLEKLAEHGLVDEFYDAIDADNLPRIIMLLRKVGIDEETISDLIPELDG